MNNQMQPPRSRFSGRTIAAIVLLAFGGLFALITLVNIGSTPTVHDHRGVERDCSTVNPARPNNSSGMYGYGPSQQDYVNASNLAKKCEAAKDSHDGMVFLFGFLAVACLAPGVMLLLKNRKTNAPYGPASGGYPGPAGGSNPGPATGGHPGPSQA
mgnify:FL=1